MRRRLARVGAIVGTLLLVGAVLLLLFGNAMLDGYGKRRVERAFAAAHPGFTLHIGKLRFAPGVNRLVAAPVRLRSPNVTLQADRVSLTGVRWARLLWDTTAPAEALAAAGLEATNISVEFPRAQYAIRCARLRASGPDAELAAEEIELRMLMGEEEFFAANIHRATRFRVVIPQCTVVGLAYGELLRGRSWRAQSVHFSGPTFDALVNRDKPADPFALPPLMVHEALAAIRQPLQIDRLTITNGRITYRERMMAGADPGVLTFGDVSVSAEGIANRGAITSSIEVEAQGNLMDAGLLKVRMTIPVTPTNFSFHYSGSLGAMDLTRLGAFLDIAEATRIKSGSVETALFEVAVSAGEARGHVRAIYSDLAIALLNPETGSETGLGNRFASFLANLLKIQNSSPPASAEAMKAGAVNYTRSPDEEFLQFAWFALRTGVVDVISQGHGHGSSKSAFISVNRRLETASHSGVIPHWAGPCVRVGWTQMNTRLLMDSARAMVADDKGVLAMDESHPTCNKRFAKLDIPQTGETNLKAAQQALLHRARCNRVARRGEYTTALKVDQP